MRIRNYNNYLFVTHSISIPTCKSISPCFIELQHRIRGYIMPVLLNKDVSIDICPTLVIIDEQVNNMHDMGIISAVVLV